MIKTAGFILAITTACLLLTWSEDARAQQPAGSRDRDVSQNGDVWWHQMFSMSFDGHGNFVVPHLNILNTTAASFGAAGFHGVWDADLNRDMPWMRGHVAEFQKHADVRKVFYIEGAGATKVLCRVGRDGRILFSAQMLDLLNDPERRPFVERQIRPDGRTVWFGDWQFLTDQRFKTRLGNPLPTARDLDLPPFVHPLTGREIASEDEFWKTRSARPLIGSRRGSIEEHLALSAADAQSLGLEAVTSLRDGKWLVKAGESMLYDMPFARYQVAKARRAMEVFEPDMIHYDDWDLRSPTALNARADIYLAAFRKFVKRRFSDDDCRAAGIDKVNLTAFDLWHYLRNPPWLAEYQQKAGGQPDGPLWMAARDPRWLSDKVWRAFQIACIEERLAAMQSIYCENKRLSSELLGRDVPMVANVIPTLSAIFLQRDCVDMANFEWPCFKTYGVFPEPLGYYPEARLGIGPRMAAKIGTTGHAIVDPYVEPQYSGWDGKGFTRRNYETLHKVICFDLLANRGIPAFALTWDGGYSPGSIHSAGQLHAFLNEVASVISRREYLADIGLACSSWSQIAAQPPFGGWNHEVSKRYFAEFLGWSQYLAASRDFPQWDVLPLDHVTLDELTRFKLVILPSVLVITADQLDVLQQYLQLGGRLLITGESGTFGGPQTLLVPRSHNVLEKLARRFPNQITMTTDKPGLKFHLTRSNAAELRKLLERHGPAERVLSVTGAPKHVGIYLNRSRERPSEITIDFVNYNYDLTADRLTPVTTPDFHVTLRATQFTSPADLRAEVIRYDEAAPNHVTRAPLASDAIQYEAGTVTLCMPSFTHYQIIQLSTWSSNATKHQPPK
jgi:hypothetical protein